ncbi:PREDICTED: uncharacterized protein LOC106789285 [Polistes canadensis]|uniref:uncharacterized protein LOC106789285 n=1 Tax=Polistes canadensis TaxID=91411 RepID=UPI000718C389|nr:PREDICTED: uncharacterized protein LOC106789285 [Polistes canadensis]
MTNFSVCSRSLGKCYVCKKKQSCSCLLQFSFQTRNDLNIPINDIKWQYEKHQIYDYLTMHMLQIRHVYDIYAKLFNKEESNCKCHFVMIKLTLWQLWRDCNINIKGFSLIEIDNYLAENESSFIKKPYYPFEQIEIWQFLHALLEVSWRIYYWQNNQIKVKIKKQWEHGVLAKCLNEFLTHDVYPNVGNFIGVIPREYNIFVPINPIYKLYKKIGYPPTAIDLLIASIKNRKIGTNISSIAQTTLIKPEYIFNGLNCVIIGERIHFFSRGDKPFMQTNHKMQRIEKWQSNNTRELFSFQELGPTKIIQIMTRVCPLIKDNDHQTILNMNYLLTFLEFYEIILQAAKCIVKSRKNKNVLA